MKLIIEFNENEMISALSDPHFMDLMYKIRRVSAKFLKDSEISIERKPDTPVAQVRKSPDIPVVKRKYTRHQAKQLPGSGPAVNQARSRDKICEFCLNPYHDDSKTNTRKWCSDECKQNALAKRNESTPEVSGTQNDITPITGSASEDKSFFKKKLEEEKAAKEEAKILDELKYKSKIDWKKAKNSKVIPESISL